MKTVIPAAGRGKRMMPLTEDKPKHLVEVKGRPLLTHVLESVYRFTEEYILVVGYKQDKIKEEYGSRYKRTPITYTTQEVRRGLGHAIYQGHEYINSPFLVILGDNIIQCDFERLIDNHIKSYYDATLLVEYVPTLEDAKRYGVCDVEDGEIIEIIEKPDNPPSRLVSTGFYVFEPEIFDSFDNITMSDRGEYEITSLINDFIDRGFTVQPYPLDGWRIDMGYPEDIEDAERRL